MRQTLKREKEKNEKKKTKQNPFLKFYSSVFGPTISKLICRRRGREGRELGLRYEMSRSARAIPVNCDSVVSLNVPCRDGKN